ncbi:Mu transposase C-terminal domain-containing protein [Halocynthiibacter sp.]|uniref:Mu transposase C-terminal domain-containing protein n=1 Tax=Halocynthiibacter sp. TaxID=1979210 RepID=UPI003C3D7881
MSFPFRLNYYDKLSIEGLSYRAISITEDEAGFESTDGRRSSLVLTPEAFQELLKHPNTEFIRGYYLPERQKLHGQIDVDAIDDLPTERGYGALWRLAWVQAYHQIELSGRVCRTDKSIAAVIPEISAILADHAQVAQFQHKEPRAGQKLILRKPPSPRTLRDWVKRFEKSGNDPLSLIPHYSRCGNHGDRFCLEARRLMGEVFEAYLSLQRKSKKIVYDLCRDRFKRENKSRDERGMDRLRVPSRRSVERALAKLDPYFTRVHRYGVDQANKDFALWENDLDVAYPMERLEIDEWKVDLIGLLAERGALDGLTPKQLAKIERGRRWLYVVIDCATRCIIGMRLAATPNTADAIATIADATRDKTDFAIAAGCKSDWSFYGGLVTVVSDQGAAFANDQFCTAVTDAGGTAERPVAATPQLRARVERIFGTFGTALMPFLAGRTFSNPKDRGDYPSDDLAAISDDGLMQMLIVYVVDVYHNLPHAGLKGETPRNCWERLSKQFGVIPPPSEQTRKRAFGLKRRRKVTGKGVTIYNIDYTCAALRQFHLHSHETEVDLKIDPRDLGWIMVRIGNAWHAATALQKCFDGVCLEDWRAASRELSLKHRHEASIMEDTVAHALRHIQRLNAAEQDRFGKFLRRLTPQALARAEEDNFLGLTIEASNDQDFDLPPDQDLFGYVIPLEEEEPEKPDTSPDAPDEDDDTPSTWRFEDD